MRILLCAVALALVFSSGCVLTLSVHALGQTAEVSVDLDLSTPSGETSPPAGHD